MALGDAEQAGDTWVGDAGTGAVLGMADNNQVPAREVEGLEHWVNAAAARVEALVGMGAAGVDAVIPKVVCKD